MKRGFTQTLMMVAVVLMAAQAMAMAPVIGDIPSPVVGDHDTATPANTFVYPDAIDLSKYVTDETTPSLIKWYYETVGVADANKIYMINGAPELTSSDPLDNPDSIVAAKIIAGPGKTSVDPMQGSDVNKITVRNIKLTPLSGSAAAPDASSNYAQDVTLFASDGETVSQKTITFYTSVGADDHLSPSGIVDVHRVFSGATTGSTNGYVFVNGGNNLPNSLSTKGICLSAGTDNTKDYLGYWTSPFSELRLVKNAAYRIRMTVNGTQSGENETPLWDVVLTNLWVEYQADGVTLKAIHGKQAYGADFWMYDGTGGQNAYVQFQAGGGDAVYDFWWTPAPVLTDRWNDTSATNPGLFSTAAGTDDGDALIWFRVINSRNSGGAIHQASTNGTLCLKELTVERYDMGQLTTDSTPVWNCPSWTYTGAQGSAWRGEGTTNVTVTSASDGLTVKAAGGSDASANCYVSLVPGDNVRDLSTPAVNQDDFPCSMDPKTLYKVTYMVSAPSANDEAHPVDVFWLTNEMMTQEEIQESYTSSMAWSHGMPKFAAAQPYVTFFYSNYGTNRSKDSLPAFWSSFHPKFAMTNNSGFVGPGAQTKVGALKLSGVKVEKVTGGFTN